MLKTPLQQVNLEELQKRIDAGLINRQKHPEFPLYIYNYSKTCQFGRDWDEYTLMCRGLILDEEGNIISRPFEKFFNLEELESVGQQIPETPFTVEKKYDGSLGISYYWEGKMYLATRGSFTSDQAIVGTRILHEKYGKVVISPKNTYLFEIIYPENRIVVDYGDTRDLVLLAVKDTEIGFEWNPHIYDGGFRVRDEVDTKDINALRELAKPNEEGFVIRFANGFRVKVKFDEYVRLHRIMTGVNARRVWDVLRNKDSLDEYLKGVPEEFEKWITSTKDDLMREYMLIEREAKLALLSIKEQNLVARKDQAQFIMKNHKNVSGVVFRMLDEKDYSELIWKAIEPESAEPFKIEV